MIDQLLEWDTQFLLFLNNFNHVFADPIMKELSGKWIWVPMYLSIAFLFWWRFGWRKALILVLAVGAAVALSDITAARVIRPFFERMRPTNPDKHFSAYCGELPRRKIWISIVPCCQFVCFGYVVGIDAKGEMVQLVYIYLGSVSMLHSRVSWRALSRGFACWGLRGQRLRLACMVLHTPLQQPLSQRSMEGLACYLYLPPHSPCSDFDKYYTIICRIGR